jgi:hypothetical protein
MLSSHAGDDVAGATSPWRGNSAGDDTTRLTWPRCNVDAESCCGKVVQPPRSEHRGVVAL